MSQSLDVSEIILKSYRVGKLAPLYILRSQTPGWGQSPISLKNWTLDLASKLLADHFKLEIEQARAKAEIGHSDLLFVTKEKDNKSYKADEQGVVEFLKAHEHPALELKHKLIFVHEADKLTPLLANRWLKTLEEPNENVTTFLLVDGNLPLLQTIESRAITLRIKNTSVSLEEKKEISDNFHQFVLEETERNSAIKENLTETQLGQLKKAAKSEQFHCYLDFTRGAHYCEYLLYNLGMEFVTQSQLKGHSSERVLEEIQWFQKTKAYNNPQSDRVLGLLQAITTVNLGI
ncbi:MAG: hypothetical protein NXH75_11145 [Halobacteriovoraceae bacterium]|nr:hypothetical protein [Halobacteriovoraceae bacterium]